jgi:hypothetical protein
VPGQRLSQWKSRASRAITNEVPASASSGWIAENFNSAGLEQHSEYHVVHVSLPVCVSIADLICGPVQKVLDVTSPTMARLAGSETRPRQYIGAGPFLPMAAVVLQSFGIAQSSNSFIIAPEVYYKWRSGRWRWWLCGLCLVCKGATV